MGLVNTTPRPLYPQERPGTHCIGGWVGPRVGLDGREKSQPLPGFDPRTVQPVESRCTDRAIAAQSELLLYNHDISPSCNIDSASFDINLLKPTGHVMHHQFNIQQLYVLPTLYLCVLCLSENKQRLVPLTA